MVRVPLGACATTRPNGSIEAVIPVFVAAQQPTLVLDGAHARHVQVLLGRSRVAEPAIVGDVDEHLGAMIGKLDAPRPETPTRNR